MQDRFAGTDAVRLVPRDGLEAAVEALLADSVGLRALRKEARRYALARHGPHRLAEAAGDILALAAAGWISARGGFLRPPRPALSAHPTKGGQAWPWTPLPARHWNRFPPRRSPRCC
ncbi:hypothetical protein ACFQU2_26355 [Siccirubricoccus deserti]